MSASLQAHTGSLWLDQDASQETWEATLAEGGALSQASRRAAITAALPLIGTYFSSGAQPLSSRTGLSRTSDAEDVVEALLAGLRLRAAIAAAQRLVPILNDAARRQTFRYATRSVTVVGSVTGQLDVARLMTRGMAVEDPPEFPVLTSERVQITSENVLAYYAATWVLSEMRDALRTPVRGLLGSADHAAAEHARRALMRVLRSPAWASCERSAREVRRGRERQLIADVRRRLKRREIPARAPYESLVAWMEECLSGDASTIAGDIDWSFYGERFDTKLFEIWCLGALAQQVSTQLGVDHPVADLSRRGVPAYRWDLPAGSLQVHFQRALTSVVAGSTNKWHRTDAQGRSVALRGIPDLVAVGHTRDGSREVAVIDPKLRQRSGPPSDELYKILGYFANHEPVSTHVRGAILFYTTRSTVQESYEYRSAQGGVLLAVPLNPASPQANVGMRRVAAMLVDLLDA